MQQENTIFNGKQKFNQIKSTHIPTYRDGFVIGFKVLKGGSLKNFNLSLQ